MGGRQFLTFLHASSRSSCLAKPTRPFFYNTIKNYGQGEKGNHRRLMEERAPSTAEEFQRVADEKAKVSSQQGVASQTVDKAYDGAEEAIANSKVESVKNRFKEHEPVSDKKGD